MNFFPSAGIADWMVWLALAVLFMIAEVATVNLISIWFAVGSIAALGISLTGLGIGWQIGTFIVFSGITLFLFLKYRGRLNLTTKTIEKTNADRNVGKTGIVTVRIDEMEASGQVRVGGQIWSAASIDGSVIEKDELVDVTEIKGVKLLVRKTDHKEEK